MTLSPALARILAAGRPPFNARVAAARRARPGFDGAALAQAIRERLDPVVAAVAAIAPDAAPAVADAGFDMILGLAGHGIAGERGALVDRVWQTLAVAHASSVAERPFAVLAMLTNAALTIAATPGARVDEWIDRMSAMAPQVTAETLRAAGQVVAWRSGMAHYRDGAIVAADGLPDAVAAAAIGSPAGWAEIRAALVDDPWWTPAGEPTTGITFGGFTGFGGPFAEPPSVRPGPHGFLVRSGLRTGLLVVDAWGATLHPADPAEFDDAATSAPVHVEGASIAVGDRTVRTELPPDGLAAVASPTSVAIFSRYSHLIRIVPWRIR
ncbi:hypothetical protein [Sphingomonas endolithica]|uniref:hypothetical protein n=1 Tax=Sphingomonas endolithica TaxID=2972485 RepID=UPI0021AFAD26|nr:hypothetical protein [Sphingomonas sp. ZFBP2030]